MLVDSIPDRLRSRKLWLSVGTILPLLANVVAPGTETDVAEVVAQVKAGLAVDGGAVDVATLTAVVAETLEAETWIEAVKTAAFGVGAAIVAAFYVISQGRVDAVKAATPAGAPQ